MRISKELTCRGRQARLRGVAAVASLLLVSACGTSEAPKSGEESPSPEESTGASLDGFTADGITLTYIIDPPNVFEDDSGEVTGASAEAMRAILAKIGIEDLEFSNVPFDSTIPTLTSKRADLTSFIFNINPDRCSQIAFTNPVYIDRDGLIVPKGNPKDIHSWDDLAADESIVIATMRGDAHISWLNDYGIPDSRITQFDSLPQAVQAVATGRADAYVNGVVNIAGGLPQGGDAVELAEPFSGPVIDGEEMVSYGGFGMSYDNIDLLNAINATIAEMIESGELAEIMDPRGYPKQGVPEPTLTAKSLCPDAPWPAEYVDLAVK